MRSRFARTSRTWLSRALAMLLAVIFVAASVTIDGDCLLGSDTAGDTSDERSTPCPCPLDCASCVVARTVPPTPPVAELLPTVSRPLGEPPPIAAAGPPIAPEPGEITHVPRA